MARGQILHVDDDPELRLLIAASLQEFGYPVVPAGTLAEALQLASEFHFDLFILDVKLPDGTGVELCQKLHRLQPASPVVYYSGHLDTVAEHNARAVCGDAYLKKPVSAEELEKTIAGLLDREG